MLDVVCRNPFHERHEGEPGWCALLGHREGPETGTVMVDGLYCSACAQFVVVVREGKEIARKLTSTWLEMLDQLSENTGLRNDEVAFLLSA